MSIMLFLALLIFLANIIASIDVVRMLGVRRISFAMLMCLAVLICFYTLFFNFLGIFKLISSGFIITFELIFVPAYFFIRKEQISFIVDDFIKLLLEYKFYLISILSLLVLVLLSAVLLPPNNQDSMSYHLARVVHWIQNGNINYYFTSVDRQNRMGPGAEIVIMLLQLLSFSDRLANLLQYVSFLFFCLSLPDILKAIGIRRRNILFISVLTISTPMLLLQAATTQNDLLSGVLTWALILVLLKVYRNGMDTISNDFFVLTGVLVSAAYLVKPTSLLILFPMFVYIALVYIFKFRSTIRTYLFKIGIVLIVFFSTSGPDLYRKFNFSSPYNVSFANELYPVSDDWNSSRFFNVILAGMHHSPRDYAANKDFIEETANFFKADYDKVQVDTNWNFFPHEDYAGNPFQFLVFLVMTLISFVILIWCGFNRRFHLSLLPIISFFVLGLFIKDNPWISRIQLPLFLIIPMCFISMEGIRSERFHLIYRIFFTIFSLICLGLGFLTVSQNAHRPLTLSSILNPSSSLGSMESLYYLSNKDQKPEHDRIINLAKELKYKTIGVVAGPGFLEYPLLWQLQKIGVRLIHIDARRIEKVDMIYIETASTQIDLGNEYVKADEKLYALKRPITTLREKKELNIALASLLLENGTVRPKSIFFYGNGKISTQNILFSPGTYTVSITSSGANVADQGSHWNVVIGNRKIGDVFSTKVGQVDSLVFNVQETGEYNLTMDFDNDIYDPARGLDRNGEIEKISIKATKPKVITALVNENRFEFSLSTLFFVPGTMTPNGTLFYGNGRIYLPTILLNKGKFLLNVKSNGAIVAGLGSHWSVFLENNQIADFTSNKAGQMDSLLFEITKDGEYSIRMDFDNDMFDPVKGLDRNGEIVSITLLKQ
jgi:hypothetical protein